MNDLRQLAEAADEGYSGAHPRDSNNWKANEAFCRAASPKAILAPLDACDYALKVIESSEGFRLGNPAFEQASAAIRAASRTGDAAT